MLEDCCSPMSRSLGVLLLCWLAVCLFAGVQVVCLCPLHKSLNKGTAGLMSRIGFGNNGDGFTAWSEDGSII